MNKYFVLEVTTTSEGTAKAVWEHDTLEAAKGQYHSIMASAYSNPSITYALCQIVDSTGMCQITEVKNAPVDSEE